MNSAPIINHSRSQQYWFLLIIAGLVLTLGAAGVLWLYHAQYQSTQQLKILQQPIATMPIYGQQAAQQATKLLRPLPAKPIISALLLQTAAMVGLTNISYQDLPADTVIIDSTLFNRQRLSLTMPIDNDQKIFAYIAALKPAADFYIHVERLSITRMPASPTATAELNLAFYGAPESTPQAIGSTP